jgi:hypothetical protein
MLSFIIVELQGIIPKLMALRKGWFIYARKDFEKFASLGTKRIGAFLTLYHHGLQDFQTRLLVSFLSLLSSSIVTQMDQVVNLDFAPTWATIIAERALYLGRLCQWPWKTCPLHSIKPPYGMHTHEMTVTNLR